MAKHITKSVIEDIAYEIKRVGLVTKAYEDAAASAEMIENFGQPEDFDFSGTATLDWLLSSLEEVFLEHDPTFDADRFRKQASFEVIM